MRIVAVTYNIYICAAAICSMGLFGIAFRRPKNAFEIIEKINYKYKKIEKK